MCNSSTSKIIELDKPGLKINLEKELVLIDVMHVPYIGRSYLHLKTLLVETNIKLVFKTGKVILMNIKTLWIRITREMVIQIEYNPY